jgi:hypothetical protein
MTTLKDTSTAGDPALDAAFEGALATEAGRFARAFRHTRRLRSIECDVLHRMRAGINTPPPPRDRV